MLTKREKELMYQAFYMGFDCGMNDKNNGYSKRNLREVFNEWLSGEVSASITLEMCLDDMVKGEEK